MVELQSSLDIAKWWRLAYLDSDIQLNQSYDSLICIYFRDLSLAAWKIIEGEMIHLDLYKCSWLWDHEEHIFGFSGNGSGENRAGGWNLFSKYFSGEALPFYNMLVGLNHEVFLSAISSSSNGGAPI